MLHERPEWRERQHVFRDRDQAGEVLAEMLSGLRGPARVYAIPAGGVPVAAALARRLGLPLEVAVVSKVTLPWNREVGYGAVAFDGSAQLNEALIAHLGLSREEVRRGVAATLEKVRRREAALRGAEPLAPRPGETAVVVDDGLASGFTLRTAVDALRRAGAARVVIAVPTGSRRAVAELVARVEALYCPNVRGGAQFAVADAYERWVDVDEAEAAALLAASG